MRHCQCPGNSETFPAWSGTLALGKFLLLGALVFLASSIKVKAVPLRAIPCTLAWDASADANVKGYVLYYGVQGSTTTNSVDVGLTNRVILKDLYAFTNYLFFMVSYDGGGQTSSPSAVIHYTPPAVSAAKLVRLTNGTMKVSFLAATNASCHIEYSPTPQPFQWQALTTGTADANGKVTITDPLLGRPASRYYRIGVP